MKPRILRNSEILACIALIGWAPGLWAWTPGTGSPTAVQGFTVNATSRTDVLSFYHTIYTASDGYVQNMAWTGNLSTGTPGTTSAAFKDDVRRRINFYRALTGQPADITFDATKSSKCQEAALVFSANDRLDHSPTSSWLYYTANAYQAAQKSNIALGLYGAGAVDAYMTDNGGGKEVVGHRRWLLYSRGLIMGTGDVPPVGASPASNAIWVNDTSRTTVTNRFFAWPNAGFVPQNLVPARWSLSYPGANFGNATVTMTRNSVAVPVIIITNNSPGFGDNTIAWEPSTLSVAGLQDVVFQVTVSGISGTGIPTSHSYSVTSFHPNVLGQSMTISGNSTVPVTGGNYTFNSITQADQYRLRVSTGSTAAWSAAGENLLAILNKTSLDYNLTQSTVKRSGTGAYHLTFPSFAISEQGFEVDRDIMPSATSQLIFYDLFRWVTTGSRLSAEVSEDSGLTWTELWVRNGNGSGSSLDWDSTFQARSISLTPYAGKLVRIRFMFRWNGSTFLGTDTDRGIFLDDISVSSATELVNTTSTTLASSATSFTLNATTAGSSLVAGTTYYLRMRPNVGTKWFNDSPLKLVTAQSAITPFTTWQSGWFSAAEISGEQAALTQDFDRDGTVNLLEYAFGKNPKVADQPAITSSLVGSSVKISFPCDASRTDLTYTVQSSSTLAIGSWTDIARSVGGARTSVIGSLSTVSDTGSGQRTVTVTDSSPLPAGGKRFLRVRVDK